MSAGEDPVVVAFPAPDVFPIGTRVQVRGFYECGTVRAWAMAPDDTWYVVAFDGGTRAIASAGELTRARPRADWRPTLVLNMERN